jgi:hypothetical protein
LPPASFILIKGGIMKKKFEKNTKYTSSNRKFKIIEKCTKLQTLDGKTYLFFWLEMARKFFVGVC